MDSQSAAIDPQSDESVVRLPNQSIRQLKSQLFCRLICQTVTHSNTFAKGDNVGFESTYRHTGDTMVRATKWSDMSDM